MVRILIVEDETRLAEILRRGLEAKGFAVDVATDGIDGLWLAEQRVHDVILLDIMLPGKDGFAICAELRAAGIWTPILMLTARDRREDEVRSLDTGADDYLTKPFAFAVLLARLRALLRRAPAERAIALETAGIRLDPAARRCYRHGAEVQLTSREFAVLEYLMRNAGAVVSKAQILDHVWDFAFEGDPNIVEVYVRRLRRKLDDSAGHGPIETVRLGGYRLSSGSPAVSAAE